MGINGLEKFQRLRLKPKVLIFIDWFLPGFKAGGPIQSISNLVNHLGDEIDISIVTSNRDLGEERGYENIEPNIWITKKNYKVLYLNESQQNLKKYEELKAEKVYDAVYFNSLFSVKFTLLPLWLFRKSKSNIILAPRGMLGAGALNIKAGKKKVFLKLFKLSGIAKNIIWHATAESEAKEIRQHFGDQVLIRMAPNLSSKIKPLQNLKEKAPNILRLFFLSRIAEKKNLKVTLDFLKKVNSKITIDFSIIGPVGEEGYWKECQRIIEELPSNINVDYLGAIPNQDLSGYLVPQQFMLLPTLHENFGHVIMESWQNACPVIISDQTPWRDLEEKGIGWDISLSNPDKFVQVIEAAAAMDQEEYTIMSQAAFAFAKNFTSNPEVLDSNRKLFQL